MPKVDPSRLSVTPGRPYPMGPIVYEEGVRFTLFSRHATQVWLAVFENIEDLDPVWEYAYDPIHHRTGDVWSVFVHGLGQGAYFKYRVDGPFEPDFGHRFDGSVYLLDPYAKAFVGDIHNGTMKCVAVHDEMDWWDDVRPQRPMNATVIYEAHVRGFTKDDSSGVDHPGTYEGLIEKIPYLVDLGVTAVELLPVAEFGETLIGRVNAQTGEELTNYWGYSNVGFFAPSGRYACSAQNFEHLEEFRRMVHALHNAGLEVILDVVFNHTSEGDERGVTLCFRGLDNAIYYLLEDDGAYFNYSGCGNTVNCNHPLVRDFILDCLRYWVAVMHVDGFRFDLASILGRDEEGDVRADAPLVRRIAEDPVLRDVKLIAEAWDAGGAYQVGSFGGVRWAEWNGRYRDDVRRYWRGEEQTHGAFASRIMGSADLYQWADRTPEHSINFVTCHDGFTLRDLVCYKEKHNEANGENGEDGNNGNLSCNCGIEGPTDDPRINACRLRMQKNYLATLFLSLGVPMLLGGDEFGRTQQGNNNAYCQDNEISWFDWALLEPFAELHRFCREAIRLRRDNPAFTKTKYYNGENGKESEAAADVLWFGLEGEEVDWQGAATPLACRVDGAANNGYHLYLAFNNTEAAVTFNLPEGPWRMRLDTNRRAPADILPRESATPHPASLLTLGPKSMAVLEAT